MSVVVIVSVTEYSRATNHVDCSNLPLWVFSDTAQALTDGFRVASSFQRCPMPKSVSCQTEPLAMCDANLGGQRIPTTCDWDTVLPRVSAGAVSHFVLDCAHFHCAPTGRLECGMDAAVYSCRQDAPFDFKARVSDMVSWKVLAVCVSMISIGATLACAVARSDLTVLRQSHDFGRLTSPSSPLPGCA